MSEASDELLMMTVQRGQLDMLNALVIRYQQRVYNYFLRATMDAADSADLTQNTFIRVMKYRKSYKAGNSFETWLFQIARNQVKDHFKKMKVHSDRFNPVEVLPEKEDHQDELQYEREQTLMLAMKQLPDDKRELLVLSKFQGMKYEQIAELRETSVSAIKVQVHRTIKQLKEIYFEIEKNLN
ncbi:RNA polymerase sigma factor [Marinoscillum sp.]|uniref:RNA polymerase sigma factor n=1 Tax=Marinoscillum sp. TaxID=2024838 RepID=UPI003BACC98F